MSGFHSKAGRVEVVKNYDRKIGFSPDLHTVCLHLAVPVLRKTQVCPSMLMTRTQFCVMDTMEAQDTLLSGHYPSESAVTILHHLPRGEQRLS